MRHSTTMSGAQHYYGQMPEVSGSDTDPMQYLKYVEELAPTVSRLLSGLSPAEQAGVLRAKITQLAPYASMPVVGGFARNRMAQYEARLVEVEKSAEYQRSLEGKTDFLYTIGIAIGLAALLFVGTKAIKELK